MHFSSLRLLAGIILVMSFLSCCSSPSDSGPLPPTSVNAANTTSQDTISWTASSGATSYNLYWSTTSGVTKANGTKIAGAASPSTQTGLANGTTYYYVVTAVNAFGESPASSQVSATPIAAPTGAVVDESIRLAETIAEWNFSWNAVTGATSYNVCYSLSSGVTPLNGTKISVTGGSLALRLAGVPVLHSCYFIVTAVNSKGESAPSSPEASVP